LPTAGKLIDPQGRMAGWQFAAGDYGDRDLKFFDAMLASLRQDYRVDNKRIFVTGHSNGGGFSYLLWAERPGVFAAYSWAWRMAPSIPSSSGVRVTYAPRARMMMTFSSEKRSGTNKATL